MKWTFIVRFEKVDELIFYTRTKYIMMIYNGKRLLLMKSRKKGLGVSLNIFYVCVREGAVVCTVTNINVLAIILECQTSGMSVIKSKHARQTF